MSYNYGILAKEVILLTKKKEAFFMKFSKFVLVKNEEYEKVLNIHEILSRIEKLLNNEELLKSLVESTNDNVFLRHRLEKSIYDYNEACERADRFEKIYYLVKDLTKFL